jgi:rSAM/selenodomain-associated transferase 2
MDVAGLSVVIPTLNAAAALPSCLAALTVADAPALDVVIADGGSHDGTAEVARAAGATVVAAPRGRGTQLLAGVAAASAPWVLVLHADTVLAPGWPAAVAAFVACPANARRAGYGRLVFDDPAPAARRLERIVAWRSRRLGLPYGDQGLLLRRDFHDALGGYPPWPVMEDVDLVRRIGRRRLVPLAATAVTSAARYRRDGWLRRSRRNLGCLALYYLGADPHRIARRYAR